MQASACLAGGRAGVAFHGGNFRVSRRVPGSGPVRPIEDTLLDYREIRLGAGLNDQWTAGIGLAVDVGLVADRTFDYFDRDFRLNGDTGVFATLALSGRF